MCAEKFPSGAPALHSLIDTSIYTDSTCIRQMTVNCPRNHWNIVSSDFLPSTRYQVREESKELVGMASFNTPDCDMLLPGTRYLVRIGMKRSAMPQFMYSREYSSCLLPKRGLRDQYVGPLVTGVAVLEWERV
jgi:hypothetical protein